MRHFFKFAIMALAVLGWLGMDVPARAYTQQYWRVVSPDHGQTFAYGSESHRQWIAQGADRHLALLLTYTNDPYVDRTNPRQWDYFSFDFPSIKLGADGRTFYYRTSKGRLLPVAEQKKGFLGITEVRLLPNSQVLIQKPHGYLTVTLMVQDVKAERQDGF